MKNRVITISREFGSGGRTIGKKVAQALGIPCYDSELLQKIAVESGFNENYIKDAGEYAPSGFLSAAFSHRGFGPTNADYLWEIQYKIITELAEQGPCVIVGRCADYVLKDRPGVTHIFIYASEERRIARIMRVEKVDREHARELIRKTDRQRRSYYNFFADGNWGMRSNYDLMLRTDGRRPEDVADIIIAFAKMRADG